MTSSKTPGRRGSSSATMESLRNYQRDEEVGGADVTAIEDEAEPTAEVAEIVEGRAVDAAAERAAAFVAARGYGPNTVNLVGYIAEHAYDTADLNVVIIEQMAIRFASAESADDILDPFGTVRGEDMLGHTLHVTGCNFLESDIAEGFPWYVSLTNTDRDTGRSRVVTVGGEKLVMQAAAIDRADGWPVLCQIHRSDKATKAGFYPLELRTAR